MISHITNSAVETEAFGERVGKALIKSFNGNSVVVALFGGMGMGKTTFVRGISKAFNISEPVSSPTFAIVNDYGGTPPLIHFDMYRISGWEDLETTGFYDYVDAGSVIFVEWAENVEEALPDDTLKIYFSREHSENDDRRIIKVPEKLII